MKTYKSQSEKLSLVREKTDFKKSKISCSGDAAEYARNFYHEDISIYESFFMITLNNANTTTGFVKISQGGITGTVVDVRIIAKYAIDNLSVGVILVHNHPSGKLIPSNSDKDLTIKIKEGLSFLDIKTLDHIILTKDGYFSFADEQLI